MTPGGSLAGTRLLVVGASSGVGRAIGLAAAAAGASVAFAARRLELLESAVDEAGASSVALVCDVTDPASVVETVEGVVHGARWTRRRRLRHRCRPPHPDSGRRGGRVGEALRHQCHRRLAGRAGRSALSARRQRTGRLHIGHVGGPAASGYGCLRHQQGRPRRTCPGLAVRAPRGVVLHGRHRDDARHRRDRLLGW